MRKLLFIGIAIFLFGCRQQVRVNRRTLADTLEILKNRSDFRPLDSVEAYAFVNKYYLPRLDTMRTGRKIFLYQLNGRDFKKLLKYDEERVTKKYSGDTTMYVPPVDFAAPPSLSFTKNQWNSNRLSISKIIADTSIYHETTRSNYKLWHQKYGFGYMCISWPQYNANTKLLYMSEWTEDRDPCGTGRDRDFHYKRVPGGWEAY